MGYDYVQICTFILICPMKEKAWIGGIGDGKYREINKKRLFPSEKEELLISFKTKKTIESIREYR